jgi:hypothetical protein
MEKLDLVTKKNRELYIRDKGICHICNNWVPPEEATRDHIIPFKELKKYTNIERNQIGLNGQNIALAHKSCNFNRNATEIPFYQAPPLPSNEKDRKWKTREHLHNSKYNINLNKKCITLLHYIKCECLCSCDVHIPINTSNICTLRCSDHGKT